MSCCFVEYLNVFAGFVFENRLFLFVFMGLFLVRRVLIFRKAYAVLEM